MPTLNWIGKKAVVNHHRQVPFHLLKDVSGLSVGDPGTGNLIVEGDNLLALKALLPYYAGQVKCIYIDPPYNTGNEKWIYNDSVNSSEIRDWLGKVVGDESEDLTRHDKWLCMMYPRLSLLRQFLRDDGVIFISIDENEVQNLKCLMIDIFGPENFIAELPTIMNLKGNQDEFGFAGTHEYTLVWARHKNENLKLGEFEIDDEEIDEWGEDEIGFFKKGANLKSTGVNAPRQKRPNLFFPIYISLKNEISLERQSKSDIEILPITDKKEMSWRWSRDKISREPHNLIVVRNENNVSIYKKQRPAIGNIPSKKPKSFFYKPEYSSGNGTAQLKSIFGRKVFDNPKPIDLIMDFLRIGSNKDASILDSFAGSGTTGHAVMQLNKEDGGNRRFILVEMDSKICKEITAERVKRVSEGYKNSKGEKVEGLGGGFRYCQLGESLFDEKGNIRNTVRFAELAKHVYFTETGEPLPKQSKANSPLLGIYNGLAVYLLYNGILKDKTPDGGNVLTTKVLSLLPKHNGPKVIYGTACKIGSVRLRKLNIVFKQLPYKLKVDAL